MSPFDGRYDGMSYRRYRPERPAAAGGLARALAQFRPRRAARAAARELCHTAFDLGITHFDLANNYGPPPGSAEEFFGDDAAEPISAPYRDELIVSTKAGYGMWPGPYGEWGSRKYLLASLDQSLKRMGLDYVDIFYSHRVDPNTPLEETMGALDTAVRQGKALYVGISSYNAKRTARGGRDPRATSARPVVIHQPSYSMLNRWIEEDKLLDRLEAEGIGCICFSPLAQGLLTDKYLGRRARRQPRGERLRRLAPGLPQRGQSRRHPRRSTTSPRSAARSSPRWRSPGCSAIRASPRR